MTARRRKAPHLRLVRHPPPTERALIVESLPLWITTLESAGIEEVTMDLDSLRWLYGIINGNPSASPS